MAGPAVFSPNSGGAQASTPFAGTGSTAQTGSAVPGVTPGQFFADFGISSTSQQLYLDQSGNLNTYAQDLIDYRDMTQADRQAMQETMVQAGLLAQGSATGVLSDSTSLTAYKALIGSAAEAGTSVTGYLNQITQNGVGPLQNQISNQITNAQSQIASERPVVATVDNPTTLDAALTNAFDQALGYAPSADQLSAFRNALQSQQVGYAQAGNEATKASAQAELNNAKSEQSALNSLGADGIDSFLSAYSKAIHGTGIAGGGTDQGPVTGMSTTALPAGTMGPEGPASLAYSSSSTQQVPFGALGAMGHNITHLFGGDVTPATTHPVTTTTNHPAVQVPPNPNVTPLSMGNQPVHGGMWALTPGLWKQAQSLYSAAQKYATPGQAPEAIQHGAVAALATQMYDKSGSWSDVAIELAGGTPGSAKGATVPGTKTNLQNFAEGVANDVNTQLQSVQNQINTTPPVTLKVTNPDVGAEASAAAKQSDPVGYYAANAATAGSLLNQMLAGAPQMYGQATTDTFSGPVPAGVATSSTKVA